MSSLLKNFAFYFGDGGDLGKDLIIFPTGFSQTQNELC